MFVSLLVLAEYVVCGLVVGDVVVADGLFLGSGLVVGVGRSSAVAFCSACVLLRKSVIARLVSWHACYMSGIRMICSWSWGR